MLSVNSTYFFRIKKHTRFIFKWLQINLSSVLLCLLLLYLLIEKNITLQISLNNDWITANTETTKKSESRTKKASFTSSKTALTGQQKRQLIYVNRFAKIAQSEMHKYGIPASIKLAQGLLESNAGKSPLAVKNNNHFGIKCFSKKCKKGHCSNFSDDSHKDFFKAYPNAWESFRAHSLFLQSNRYKHLLGESDYKVWAKGLIKAGYATDKQYATKLIRLIEGLELYKYDQIT